LRGQRCAPKTGALGRAGQRFAEVLGLPFAELDPGDIPGDEEREAITLRDGPESVGTLLVPVGLAAAARQRVAHRAVVGSAAGRDARPPRDQRCA
jgi:hypothetical protein